MIKPPEMASFYTYYVPPRNWIIPPFGKPENASSSLILIIGKICQPA
jgi:hypothetical protein